MLPNAAAACHMLQLPIVYCSCLPLLLPTTFLTTRGNCNCAMQHQLLAVHCTTRLKSYLAMTKSSRTMRLPSPMYFCTSSLPDTRMKVQSVWCATARASSVFPVPGGPYSSTPCRSQLMTSMHSKNCLCVHLLVTSACRICITKW